MRNNIIGFSGKIGSGKNTAATLFQLIDRHRFLEQQPQSYTLSPLDEFLHDVFFTVEESVATHFGTSSEWKQKGFADKLKLVCSIITGEPIHNFIDSELKKQQLGREWDIPVGMWPVDNREMTRRMMLQLVGTSAMRDKVHANVWVNALFSDYKEGDKWLITDVRFPNEFDAVKSRGGVVIRMERDYHIKSDHISETALDSGYRFDFTIDNNGPLKDLPKKLLDVINQLQ